MQREREISMGLLKFTEEITIPVPWGHIAGKFWGSKDNVPILAMHGWLDNAGTFDHLLPLITDKVSVLAIDLPGHGYSSHYPKGLKYDVLNDNVIVVKRIMEYLGWQKISFLGHSLGCNIAFIFTGIFPDLVNLIIALDSVAPISYQIDEEFTILQKSLVHKFLKYDALPPNPGPHGSLKELQDICITAHSGSLTEESAQTLMIRGASKLRNDIYKFNRDIRLMTGFLNPPSFDLVQQYAKNIKCNYLNIRALFFKGEVVKKYDQLLNIIEKNARKFQFVQEDGPHHIHMNNPKSMALKINQFLFSCGSDEDDEYF